MADNKYRTEQDALNDRKIKEILQDMPPFVNEYFRSKKNEEMASTTRLAYAYELRTFFDYLQKTPGFKNIDLKQATVDILDLLEYQDIEDYLDHMKSYTNSNGIEVTNGQQSSKRKISSLRSFYGFYFNKDMIKKNPMLKIPVPKLADKAIVTFDQEEISGILDKIYSNDGDSRQKKASREKTRTRDIAILSLLFGTGIRVSELVGIDLSDLDFKNARIKVTRKGRDESFVMFGEEVEAALNSYLKSDRNALHPDENNKDALFISLQHKRMGVRAVEIMVKKYSNEAGITYKPTTPHKCRSTFGTYVYNETGDIYVVADALGHKSVETTKKHYANIDESHKRIAASVANGLFSSN